MRIREVWVRHGTQTLKGVGTGLDFRITASCFSVFRSCRSITGLVIQIVSRVDWNIILPRLELSLEVNGECELSCSKGSYSHAQ